MSFGGSPHRQKFPPVRAAAPIQVLPEIEKQKFDLRERLKRSRSRQMSLATTPGLLNIAAPGKKPVLSDLL